MLTASGLCIRATSIGVAAMIAAAAAGCGLQAPVVSVLPGGVPASAPPATSVPAPSTAGPAWSAPTPTEPPPTLATPTLATPAATPRRALPSFPPATEPPCAVPRHAPTTVEGADGPRLTLKRVASGWRASPTGKSLGVTTGRVSSRTSWRGVVSPSSVLDEPGLPWADLTTFEWSGTRTYVLADQGRAAAKLAAVRLMLARPCSTQFGSSEPAIAFTLTVDEADYVMATGSFGGLPFAQLFVRYGNTVTLTSGVGGGPPDAIVAMVRKALSKA